MRTTLRAIEKHPNLRLRIIATGMHLDRRLGRSLDQIRKEGWRIDGTAPWVQGDDPTATAASTGRAIAALAPLYEKLAADVVLVVGDRVEAFAAAAAAHVGRRTVAHVHGGDRALGQVDDSLRHAITKLAHIHFPATRASAARIKGLGEDSWRIHHVGSPGVDGIVEAAEPWKQLQREFPGLVRRRFGLVVLHPTDADPRAEGARAELVARTIADARLPRAVVIYPNNDPGATGIMDAWDVLRGDTRLSLRRNVPRGLFLALLRDAAMLVGNSSSGIIEAASFGTPVIDIGDRQAGRERGTNVIHVRFERDPIRRAILRVWNGGRPKRAKGRNVYGGGDAGRRIADVLGRLPDKDRILRKLITY